MIALSGCGGGSGDGSGSASKKASEDHVRTVLNKLTDETFIESYAENIYPLSDSNDQHLIDKNNLWYCAGGYLPDNTSWSSLCAENNGLASTGGLSIRFHATPEDPIHYYFNNSDEMTSANEDLIKQSLNELEAVMGTPGAFKFMGYTDIDTSAEHPWKHEIDYSTIAGEGGVIFSVGTTIKMYNDQQTCGTVSGGPNMSTGANLIIDENNYLNGQKGFNWINLGDKSSECWFDKGIVMHEVAHYLGFMINSGGGDGHWPGFGEDGGTFDDRAKAVLRTLYQNPAQSEPQNMQVYLWPKQ
ncbi:hypothetical protein C9I98_02760 [Photobacterium sanctipauli]|uniref:Uncharacterized protein n=3 Tax=Photobacterium sanctipauli TaxID=1342794 RepID=A0A2T3P0Z7_9GAMM|nr:hypothetical protein C9I98_02760 [Photobacterium sanctipauli]